MFFKRRSKSSIVESVMAEVAFLFVFAAMFALIASTMDRQREQKNILPPPPEPTRISDNSPYWRGQARYWKGQAEHWKNEAGTEAVLRDQKRFDVGMRLYNELAEHVAILEVKCDCIISMSFDQATNEPSVVLRNIENDNIRDKLKSIRRNCRRPTAPKGYLFAVWDSELLAPGKRCLQNLVPRLVKVVENNHNNISNISIEGHSSSEWGEKPSDYFYGMPRKPCYDPGTCNTFLSTDRSHAALVFSRQAALSKGGEQNAYLFNKLLRQAGLGSQYAIYKPNGEEDKEASRRIEFRFIIKIDR